MSDTHLATYLNDHLAGSVGALELLEYLAAAYAGTDVASFATELHADILADRRELESLMSRLQIGQSVPRKASAWLAEKVTRLKLKLDDPRAGDLRLLESAEAVSLGVEGKRLLWRALASASEHNPALRVLDYDRLALRAEEQRQRLETVRLKAAVGALR